MIGDTVTFYPAILDIDDCASHVCKNGATCQDAVNAYTCVCPPGYMGAWCQEGNAVDECASNPCLNGATCSDVIGGYRCTCADLFAGVNCEAGG